MMSNAGYGVDLSPLSTVLQHRVSNNMEARIRYFSMYVEIFHILL